MFTVRKAVEADLETILDLAEKKRAQYAAYQPVFHRPAADARKNQKPYLASLISKENVLLLVVESDGKVRGFANAAIVSAPPVYDPRGKVCMIDDFMVDDPSLWPTAGAALAKAAFEMARPMGAVLGNIVCGPKDGPKRAMIKEMGFDVASEWFVKPLDAK